MTDENFRNLQRRVQYLENANDKAEMYQRLYSMRHQAELEFEEKEDFGHGPNCICNVCHCPTDEVRDKNDSRIGVKCTLWNTRDHFSTIGYPKLVIRRFVQGRMLIVGFIDKFGVRWDKAE